MNTTLEKQLQTIQEMKASDTLKERISGLAHTLPTKHKGFYLPLVAFQTALVIGVLVLLVSAGSEVVAVAKTSQPGSPLYPIREMIEKVPTSLAKPTALPTRIPMQSLVVPTKALLKEQPSPQQKPHTGENAHDDSSSSAGKAVRGITTSNVPQSFSKGDSNKEYIMNHFGQVIKVEKFFKNFFQKGNNSHNGKEDK